MPPWLTAVFNWLGKVSPRYVAVISLLTGVLLLGSDKTLKYFDLDTLAHTRRGIIALIFGASVVLLASYPVSTAGRWIATPVAERIAARLKRKPRLYANFHPVGCLWGLGRQGDEPLMQVRFEVDLTHDDPEESLIIVDAHPEGTHLKIPFEKFVIPPRQLVERTLAIFVQPVVGEKGKDWTGHIVLVDQFKRSYKTQKTTFRAMV